MVVEQPLQDGWDTNMAKARAADKTPGSSGDKRDRPETSWSLGGGERVDPAYAGANPSGATPTPWVSGLAGDVTPYNQANPAAMRAYTRNAPYMEGLVNDPRAMLAEMQNLQIKMAENPNDLVSEYRLRILKQAIGDIYGVQNPDNMGAYLSYPTTPRGR